MLVWYGEQPRGITPLAESRGRTQDFPRGKPVITTRPRELLQHVSMVSILEKIDVIAGAQFAAFTPVRYNVREATGDINIPVKLPCIFLGAPLIFNGVVRNIQGNLTGMYQAKPTYCFTLGQVFGMHDALDVALGQTGQALALDHLHQFPHIAGTTRSLQNTNSISPYGDAFHITGHL